jgi:WD40 repeat protein
VWSDKVRAYNVNTGECVRDLDDNKDGSIVGISINPENKKSLIACTANGTVVTWKLDSFVILEKLVS